ncbi:MAG: dihydropteroate synthase [candidate division Zixibacteria bacterium]|nr:dihydropteroate synthase [candidate division Zixibacteria bacterium]
MNFEGKKLNQIKEEKASEYFLEFRNRKLNLSSRPHLMGVLNVTPDSFSDGGRFYKLDEAIKQGVSLAEEGADIIDVGGESTRPGSEPVPIEEELKRVIPVIEELAKRTEVPISIDTYKSKVAKEALDSGAQMVNDISALRFDPEMKNVVAYYRIPVALMHIQGTPRNMQENPFYENVVEEIKDYLKESIKIAKDAGIEEEKILVDPGIGFGKTLEDNLKILRNLKEFTDLGRPLLIGVSRKSFIGKILDLPVEERLEGSLSALTVCIMSGANVLRVHDVKKSKRVARLVDAILRIG